MRIVFAGTPVFAAAALQALADAGHSIVSVLTQPDRPAGRGMKLQASPVKQLALQRGLTVLQPDRLRAGPQAESALQFLQNPDGQGPADVMVVAAYGLILPRHVLDLPRYGCLNIHASLLPRWRGAAPIHRAIEAGDVQTGITIMQMDEGLDTGGICRVAPLEIGDDSTGQLHDRLADLGASEIVAAIADLENGRLIAHPQPSEGVTYASKVSKEEAEVDWNLPARVVRNRIAAMDPAPGAFTQMPENAGILKLFDAPVLEIADELPASVLPGTVLSLDAGGVRVACATGSVLIRSAQRAGGKRMPASIALQGTPVSQGKVLGQTACATGN